MNLYTTKTGSKVLGIKQDTLKRYALKYGVGFQPGGPGTPHLFTREDIMKLKDIRSRKWGRIVDAEDREDLGLPPVIDPETVIRKRNDRDTK